MTKNYSVKSFLILCQFMLGSVLNVHAQTPTIISFSPVSAKPGDAITIIGTNFNATAGNNVVFFGATRATVTAATATSLTVIVPTAATYAPITELNIGTGLTCASLKYFNPVFRPAKIFAYGSLGARQDFGPTTTTYGIAIGDIDGDGKTDVIYTNADYIPDGISVLRNTSNIGTINFASQIDLVAGGHPISIAIGDIDGDGKPDVVATYNGNSSSGVSVFRNTSSSGIISFAAKADFATATYPYSVAIGDIDGDGKPDLVTGNNGSNTVSVLRNTSSSGTISFAAKVDFATDTYTYSVAIGDIDGDGKIDLATANVLANNVSVLRNTSSNGIISFAPKADFATGTNPYSVAIGDLDGDNLFDLAVGGDRVSILRNNGSSGTISFEGRVDFLGNGSASIKISDMNGDGKPDLATAGGGYANVLINGSSVATGIDFSGLVGFSTPGNSFVVAAGDLDGDGQPDLVNTNSVGGVSVFCSLEPPPVITSFIPASGKPGDAVAITGTSFNTTASNNVVFFGATRATVTSATDTSLIVTVPAGATYAPITELNTGTILSCASLSNFNPVYSPPKSGIDTADFATRLDIATGTNTNSVAIGDLDGDGQPDLVVTNANTNSVSVFRNISTSGTIIFAAKVDFATGTTPVFVSIGDIDGDGKPDIVTANSGANGISVLHNTSSSGIINFDTKADFITGDGPSSVAIGDFDRDGKPDIVIAHYVAGYVSVLHNISAIGTISFDPGLDLYTSSPPFFATIGDIDGDSKSDIVTANYSGNTVSVFHNKTAHGFINFDWNIDFLVGKLASSVSIGDINGDGKPDLVTSNGGDSTVSVLRNTSSIGTISFAPKSDYATGAFPNSIAIADINGDGKPDLATANSHANTISILHNTGTSGAISFATQTDFATDFVPVSIAVGDLDGDARPDLATANTNGQTVSVLRATAVVLPLRWISVNGSINTQKQAIIHWLVNEKDVATYEIEKSIDGNTFIKIGTINSAGNGINNYEFTDVNVLNNMAYYRIRQVDIDSRFSYSTVLQLSTTSPVYTSVFPNPFNSYIIINSSKKQTVAIVDVLGRTIKSIAINRDVNYINTTDLINGIYFVRTGDGVVIKMVKE